MNGSARADPDARPSPSTQHEKHPLMKLDIHREPQNQLYLSKSNSTRSATRHHKCTGTTPPPPGQRFEVASAKSARRTSTQLRRSESALSTKSAPRSSAPPDRSMSTTPAESRLPKPMSSFSIRDAWKQAELEEDERERVGSPGGIDASPSPAPRAWRLNKSGGADRRGAQSPIAKDSPTRALRTQKSMSRIPQRSVSSASQHSSPSVPGSPGPRRMSDFGKGSPAASFLAKARAGSRPAKVGEGLDRRASNSSLNGRVASPAQSKGAKNKVPTGFAETPEKENAQPDKGASNARADAPVQSIEESPDARPPPSWDALEDMSPHKSYAWEMDAEFTAGDLQISDSPRIRFDMNERPPNMKLDEIMEREARDLDEYPAPEGPRPRIFSTRSDEIEELENKIDDFAKPDQDRPRNTLIDDIRARELEFSSPAAIAASKLDDIRAKNSQFRPRSAEPVPYRPSPDFAQELSRYFDADSDSDNGDHWIEGERIPDTPVTVFRKSRQERPNEVLRRARASSNTEDYRSSSAGARDRSPYVPRQRVAPAPGPGPEVYATHGRSDGQQGHHHDINPEQSTAPQTSHTGPPKSSAPEENGQEDKPATKAAKDSENPDNSKPAVGSTDLRRAPSSRSAASRKSKMSDSDPTERIEREVQLFAPVDTQSDRGSIRVPTPVADDEGKVPNAKNDTKAKAGGDAGDVEATPRPKRREDILSRPTPRVTGAYVETPATVKVEPLGEQMKASAISTAPLDETNVIRRRRSYSTSDKGESDRETSRKQVRADRTRRRARSLTKHRQPLVNSAKPPTVRDDLIELQKTHNIEDSTLDAFELQEAKNVPESPEIDEMLEGMADKFIGDAELGEDWESEAVKEFSARMGKMLDGIRSSKQGIERLENQVSHINPEKEVKREVEEVKKEGEQEASLDTKLGIKHETEQSAKPEAKAKAKQKVKQEVKEKTKSPAPHIPASHVSIPIPRFYRRSPFRLTFSGLLLLAFAIWYAAESAVCVNYCRPLICTSPPCVWSLEDPTFGYAIVSKVDDWTTGGQGRELSARVSEEISDLSADVWDYVTGTDIWSVDPSVLEFEDRKRLRRRLQRKEAAAKRAEPARHDEKWDAWRTEREAKERANAAMEMGYAFYEESESMNDDVVV